MDCQERMKIILNKPIEYEQKDVRWKDVLYTKTNNKKQTIGTSGCGTTSAAMVIATLRDKKITPKETSAWSVANGYRTVNDGTAWAFFPAIMKKYNIPCKQTSNVNEAIEALKKNYMVITAASKGIWTTGGHIILAYGLADNGKKVLIHDPNSEAAYREIANISNFKKECVVFWIIQEDWKMEIIDVAIKDKTQNKIFKIKGVNIDGNNYIKLRDIENFAPVDIGWENNMVTVEINYNKN